MHLAIHTILAVSYALTAAALPLPSPQLPDIADTDQPIETNVDTVYWYPAGGKYETDHLRRRDSPLSNLFPEKDGFIETGGPIRRDEDAVAWYGHPSSDGADSDNLRSRDSPLHELPDEGVVGIEGPEPRIKIS